MRPFAPFQVTWTENDMARSAQWRSESNSAPPRRIVTADDTLTADTAYRLASQGSAILWRGDYQNGRQLLQALTRRVDNKKPTRQKRKPDGDTATSALDAFNQYRLHQSQRARILNSVLIELDAEAHIALRRAPDVVEACRAAIGPTSESFLLSLRALLGIIGAHEWRKKGVPVPGLPQPIHVHYGVFSPLRGEYIDLVARAPLPTRDLAFDIGTGSGVLAAVLAQRGVSTVIATDQDPRALACARENMDRLGLADKVELQQVDMFPKGMARLIVCNPPWLPAKPTTPIEHAIYDPDNRMLLGFLNGLRHHLADQGEAWLIMSDLAGHLGLRSSEFLPDAIAAAGLVVLDKLDARPQHPKAMDASDPLYKARSAEVTSLWRLGRAGAV
jgi:methylase of polypeptide subunit release factors